MRKILFLDNGIESDTYVAAKYWKPLLMYPHDMYRVALGEWPPDAGGPGHCDYAIEHLRDSGV